jgi:transposase
MSKMSRVFSQAFKVTAVSRMLAGENVSALARELGVLRKDLYLWRDRFKAGGAEALRGRGRPSRIEVARRAEAQRARQGPAPESAAAAKRIAELERIVGQQTVDLDFFQAALRHIEGTRPQNAGTGATRSTQSSKR